MRKYTVTPSSVRGKVTASTHSWKHPRYSTSVYAADDDDSEDNVDDMDYNDDFIDNDDDGLYDAIDDVADAVEDIQDTVDEVDQDDVNIDMNNNISGHYIAECDSCHGVFISATIESDQKVEKVSGICPLCEKETDQYLKWVIKSINSDNVDGRDDNIDVGRDNTL